MRRTASLAALLAALAVVGPMASPARAGCLTRLPVSAVTQTPWVNGIGRSLYISVSTRGPAIRNMTVQLYTFHGFLISGTRRGVTLAGGTRTVRLPLRFKMQIGRYTLVVTGEPNSDPGCGPKKYTHVVSFLGCPDKLPIAFPQEPGGDVSTVGSTLYLNVVAKGPVIHHLDVGLYSFAGQTYGHGKLNILFGRTAIAIRLDRSLDAGNYTALVSADIGAPKSCGAVQSKTFLTFTGASSGGGSGSGGSDSGSGSGAAPPPSGQLITG